jgi:hypothetical protein
LFNFHVSTSIILSSSCNQTYQTQACSHSESVLKLWILWTVGSTPWTGDQPVSMSLLTQEYTNTEWTQTDIHASSKN